MLINETYVTSVHNMTTGLQALAGGRACCGGRRDCVAVVSGDVLLVACARVFSGSDVSKSPERCVHFEGLFITCITVTSECARPRHSPKTTRQEAQGGGEIGLCRRRRRWSNGGGTFIWKRSGVAGVWMSINFSLARENCRFNHHEIILRL